MMFLFMASIFPFNSIDDVYAHGFGCCNFSKFMIMFTASISHIFSTDVFVHGSNFADAGTDDV